MFTTGRIIFALIFVAVFISAMIYAYRKDLKQIKKWFPNPGVVLLSLLVILFVYYVFSRFLN